MSKIILIGFLFVSIIALGTFGVMASGIGPGLLNDDNWHMGHGGRHMHSDYDQDEYDYSCHDNENINCEGPHSEECEEFCEEYGYEQQDCPIGNEDCPNSGSCY